MIERRELGDTEAAIYIEGENRTRIEGYKREIADLREELQQALSDDDQDLQEELQKTRSELEEQMSKILRDSENLSSRYAEERRKYVEGLDGKQMSREMDNSAKARSNGTGPQEGNDHLGLLGE